MYSEGDLLRYTIRHAMLSLIIFSSPEPKAPGGAFSMGSLCRPSTLSNDFFSETTGPNVTKFHI